MDNRPALAARAVAVVGNPNTGKTTLFNALTGLKQRTGNFPGCTVEKKTGRIQLENNTVEAIDLPGTYSLAAVSLDELVVPEVLLGVREGVEPVGGILVVADASTLHRNLYLVTQLMELGRPMVMALNMMDLALERGLEIDIETLSRRLGFPVVPTHAGKAEGLAELRLELRRLMDGRIKPPKPELFRDFYDRITRFADEEAGDRRLPLPPALVFRALFDESGFAAQHLGEWFGEDFRTRLMQLRRELEAEHGKLIELEARERYTWVRELLDKVIRKPEHKIVTRSERIDKFLTHKVWGVLTLFVVMTVLFQTIYAWAGPLMDGIEGLIGALGGAVGSLLPEGMLRSLVVDGIVAGVGAVLVFLPQILLLFLFIAVLEDFGYMARAAFLMDRIFSKVGLSGKSLIPLLSSFACAIPGIMATRTIPHPRDRFTTILVAPLMSCSARLPVYVIMIAAFIPQKQVLGIFGLQGLTLLGMYLVGVVVAVPTAWILKKTLLKGETPPFLMELPSYKRPNPRTVGIRVYQSGMAFVTRAGTVILAVTVVVWAMAYFPRSGEIEDNYAALRIEAEAQHMMARAGLLESFDPQLAPLSLERMERVLKENPQLAVLNDDKPPVSGDPALQALYADWRQLDAGYQEKLAELDSRESGDYLRDSYLGRMGQVMEPLVVPLGWDWRIGMATIASFPAREIIIATLGVIFNLGADMDEESVELKQALKTAVGADGNKLFSIPVALSIMVFFALCAQCAATLATIRKETDSWRWPVLSFTYMTSLAYLAAFGVFHLTTALGWG
ncbi:MAG: ferrous iron transport protein B [Acidobacteriota bacterium]|nr:ferrous iron transport protein B [Acidobacteriota bacterium]